MIYILDTDHMSVLERGGAPSLSLTLRLGVIAEANIATTIISYEEQCKGWLAKTAREKDDALIRVYAQFRQHLEIYAGMNVLPYDSTAHAHFQRGKQAKIRVGTQDMKIATIVKANSATLLTRNTQDFARIPDLQFEDWTA